MMSSFLPVNNQISSPQDRPMDDATTPTTPRATSSNGIAPKDRSHTAKMMRDDESTPRNARNMDEDPPKLAAEDSTMHDSDGDRDVSDPEPDHDDAHNAPPSKKKKGQRFYCTDFPPCNLSFTRSEHLARHIRKHTGERPFQCHCSRRFSRLDNLRQHAQTVHVNEEIPGDSLAATGTRFQRQIRTDRVRPQGRARAGTGPSQVSHSRGHARNLSTSSITSTASTFSQPSEIRRRPTSLIMPHDGTARARLALDGVIEPPTTPPAQIRSSISGPPPVGGSPYTPSSMFGGGGGGGGSPHHLASPMSTASHASSFWDGKTAARRLSVPTGINPFAPPHPQHVSAYPPAPPPAPPSYAGPTGPPPYPAAGGAGGVYASPASSNYSMSRDEAAAGAAEADLRRRTWHPSTYPGYQRPGMSGLSSYQTSDDSHDHPDHSRRPSLSAVNGPAEQHPPRLPGIESFDKVISQQQRPLTPPGRRPPSPMQVDSASSNHKPSPSYGFGGGFNYTAPSARPPPPVSGPGHRRGHVSWDLSLHANLTGLNIRDKPFQRDAAQWGQQTIAEIQNVADSRRPSTSYHQQRGSHDYQGSSGPSHHGWHSSTASGSSQATRTSPEDSSSSEGVHTPSTASLEYHPTIVQQNGSNEPHPYHHYHHQHSHQHQHQYQPPPLPPPPPHNPLSAEASHTGVSQPETYHGKHEPPRPDYLNNTARDSGMGRLEALVAVATSENKGPAKLIL